MKDWLTIGEFAKKIGVSNKALRLYEEMGLLASHERGDNGYRYYSTKQVKLGIRIREFKELGFALKEIQGLLNVDLSSLREKLRERLDEISKESESLNEQQDRIQNILRTLSLKNEPLKKKERDYIMKFFEQICVVVTGIHDLKRTADYVGDHLLGGDVQTPVIVWDGIEELKTPNPKVVVIKEEHLQNPCITKLNPDVVVVRNISSSSKEVINKYLSLFGEVGPTMATVINADDRASIELAAQELVKKGKIFYYSKNKGVEDQIKNIGGIVSDGEEIRVYGFNGRVFGKPSDAAEESTRRASLHFSRKLKRILTFDEESALIASLAAVLDVGLESKAIGTELG